MRTADRLIARDWVFPLGIDENKGFMQFAADHAKAGPVIVADNVAHYVNERNPSVCLEDYPSLAPPWPAFWLEYPSSSGRQRRGVLVTDTTEYMDTPLADSLTDGSEHVPELSAGAKKHAVANGAGADDVRWVVSLALFIEQESRVWGPAGIMSLALDGGGQVVGNRWSMAAVMALTDAVQHVRDGMTAPEDDIPSMTEDEMKALSRDEVADLLDRVLAKRDALNGHIRKAEKQIGNLENARGVFDHLRGLGASDADTTWMIRAMAPAMQAIAFLHCKNVVLDAVTAPVKVQAKRRKRGAEPLVRYHTLRLDVPRRNGSGPGAGRGLDATSLHIVAGHFSHYGACCANHEPHGMLFGRLEGVYWVPSHIRGDRLVGEVHTDFDLVAPDDDTLTATAEVAP